MSAVIGQVVPELSGTPLSDKTPLQLAALARWPSGTTPPATIVAALVKAVDESEGRRLIQEKLESDAESLAKNFATTMSQPPKPFIQQQQAKPQDTASKGKKEPAAKVKVEVAPPATMQAPMAPGKVTKPKTAPPSPDAPWSKVPASKIRENPPDGYDPEVIATFCTALEESKYFAVKLVKTALEYAGHENVDTLQIPDTWGDNPGRTNCFIYLCAVGFLRNDEGAIKARKLLGVEEGESAYDSCNGLFQSLLGKEEGLGPDDDEEGSHNGEEDQPAPSAHVSA